MYRSLRTIAALGTLSALFAGCNSGGSTPSAVATAASTSSSASQTLSVAANTPSTVAAPSAAGYTPSISIPGLSATVSAPVTTSNSVPTGVVALNAAAGPVPQSVSLQAKPSNATTLLYIGVKPNVSTSVASGSTFGLKLALPSAPTGTTTYYLAFFDGTAWYTNFITAAGTVSGSNVSWSNLSIPINYTFAAGTTYALAVYSTPSAVAASTPTSSAGTTTVTLTKPIPTPAPVPKSVTTSTKLPTPTATSTGTPLSAANKKTQGAVSATLSGLKSKTASSKATKKTKKTSQFFIRMAQGAFRKKQDESETCTDGLVETTVTNSDGSTMVEDVTYADAACATTAISDATFNYQPADANGTVTAIGGTVNYASDGVTLQNYDVTSTTIYNALATDGSYNSVSSVTHYPDTSGVSVPLGIDYLATVVTAEGSETDSTLSFTYDLTDGYELGSLYTANSTEGTPDSSGNVTTTITGNSTLYNDPAYALAVGAFPLAAGVDTWTVSGGSQVSNTTSTQTSVADVNGDLTSDMQVTTDSANDVQITFQSTPGGYTGSITQISTGNTLGTMATNEVGTGTVTYADGTTGTLTEFAVGS